MVRQGWPVKGRAAGQGCWDGWTWRLHFQTDRERPPLTYTDCSTHAHTRPQALRHRGGRGQEPAHATRPWARVTAWPGCAPIRGGPPPLHGRHCSPPISRAPTHTHTCHDGLEASASCASEGRLPSHCRVRTRVGRLPSLSLLTEAPRLSWHASVCVWRTAGQLACSAAVFRVCASPATGGALIATSGSATRACDGFGGRGGRMQVAGHMLD